MVRKLEDLKPLQVTPKYEGEPLDSMLKRLNRIIQNDGLHNELKKRIYYQKPSVKRHRTKMLNKYIKEKAKKEG